MSSSLELLESRIAPAGIITLDSDGFAFYLTGDDAGNELEVTQDGFALTLTPLNGTLIKDDRVTNPVASAAPVTINLFNDDLTNRFASNLEIDLGKGADSLQLTSLTLPDSLSVDMGPIDVAEGTRDEVEITNLRVGYDFDLRVRNGLASITGSLYAGLDADIYSDAETFTLDVSSFFVGGNLEVDTILDNDTDTFLLRADSFFVFNGFDLYANIYATGAPADAVSIDVGGVFSVGGDFLVQNDGTGGKSVVVVGADIVDIGGRLLVDNISQEPDEFLSLVIDTDVLRLNEGLTLSSKSPASSSVDIDADLAIINGPVTAKLSKSGGDLSIVADNLTIQGNVNFAVKETGHLLLQGSGDVFGKVSASLGSGSGTVQVLGSPDGELAITGLSITTPKKLPATASGAEIAIENVVVFGKAKLKLGRGGDLIDINDSVFFARATISTGAGGDTVNIHTNGDVISEFRAGLNVTLGTGNDFLNLGREEAANANTALFLYGAKKFDGGSGTDLYSAEGRNVQFLKSITKNVVLNPKVRGFEPGVIVS